MRRLGDSTPTRSARDSDRGYQYVTRRSRRSVRAWSKTEVGPLCGYSEARTEIRDTLSTYWRDHLITYLVSTEIGPLAGACNGILASTRACKRLQQVPCTINIDNAYRSVVQDTYATTKCRFQWELGSKLVL